jgi:hypothetical protein
MRISARTAAVVGAAVLTIATSASAASADPPPGTPPQTGCPAAAQVLDVAMLTHLGYGVPAQLDASGNDNGLICGIRFDDEAALHIFGPNTCLTLIGCFLWSDDTVGPRS